MKNLFAICLLIGLAEFSHAQTETDALDRPSENPAVLSTLEMPREKPSDYLQATLNLLGLDEPQLAKQIFDELLAIELSDQQRVELVREMGTASLLRVARADELGDAAREFAERCIAAAAADSNSPERMANLVQQLGSDNRGTQTKAVGSLAALGERAVLPVFEVLADDNSTDQQRVGARATFLRLGSIGEGILLSALDSNDSQLVSEAARLLANMDVPEAAALLAARALTASGNSEIERAYFQLTGQQPDLQQTRAFLRRTLANLEGGVPAFRANRDNRVRYWVWPTDADSTKPTPINVSSQDASLLYQSRLASDLAELEPHNRATQSSAIRLSLEIVPILQSVGLETEADLAKLADLSSSTIDMTLSDALDANQHYAAKLMLDVIADRRDPSLLLTHDGRPSPTARALESSHPSVRLAALEAIAAIDPASPFPGASKVCPALARIASATGEREVVAASPQVSTATSWTGGLASEGFAGQVAANGRDAVEVATGRADVELVLLDMSIGSPAVREVVFRLRRHPGTKDVPIALLARETQFATARRIASEHEGVMHFPRPHSDESLRTLALETVADLPRTWPTAAERLDQATRAVAVANKLLEGNRNFYRLRSADGLVDHALYSQPTSESTWTMLAKWGTAASQQSLIDFASNAALPIEERTAAAKAFASSVEEFGLLLTTDEILRQYDLYNGSGGQAKASQELLSGLLDTIESKKRSEMHPTATQE